MAVNVVSNRHEIISSCFILVVVFCEKQYICFNSIRLTEAFIIIRDTEVTRLIAFERHGGGFGGGLGAKNRPAFQTG